MTFNIVNKISIVFLVCLWFLMFSSGQLSSARALTPEEKGKALAFKTEEIHFDDYVDALARGEMHLIKPNGKEVVRDFLIKVLVTPGDGEKTITQFLSPADVKGVTLLSVTHKFKFDDIWLYIPDLRRVKRISSQNKGSGVMGSEFVNEDLGRQEPEKFTYRWLEEKPCGDLMCDLIERVPVEKSTIYSKQIMWLDQKRHFYHKFEFYDKQGRFLKTLQMENVNIVDGKYWRWSAHKMTNHLTGEVTHIFFKDWKFNSGINKFEFTVQGLKNSR